jgi:hypothetical protein
MTATGNLGQAQAHSQPPLAVTPPGSSVPSFRAKRPFLQSSRHTGEVARRAGGGKPQSRYLQISDLKLSEIVCEAVPLRPLRGQLGAFGRGAAKTPTRQTGEA